MGDVLAPIDVNGKLPLDSKGSGFHPLRTVNSRT